MLPEKFQLPTSESPQCVCRELPTRGRLPRTCTISSHHTMLRCDGSRLFHQHPCLNFHVLSQPRFGLALSNRLLLTKLQKYDIFTDLYPSSHSPELHQCICSRQLHTQSHHLLEKPAAISEQVGASDRVTVVTDPAACARLSDSGGVSKMRVIWENRESVFTSVLAISAHYFVSCSMEQAW